MVLCKNADGRALCRCIARPVCREVVAVRRRGPHNDTLRLFYSEDLLGPWVEHPKSPIVSGKPHIARPGGRVIVSGDRVIRYAQDDTPRYGNQVWAFEIVRL